MSRYILAFDTSGPFLDVVLRGEATLRSHALRVERGHGEALGPAVENLLLLEGIPASALSAVVVPRGPGSFTGLRIAMSFAKGLQAAVSIPVYAVDTLRAMIHARWSELGTVQTILAVIDGRKDRLYAACEQVGVDRVHHRIFGPVDENPDKLKQRLQDAGIRPEVLVVTGDTVASDQWSPYPQARAIEGGVAEALTDLFLKNDDLVSLLEDHDGPEYYRVSQAEEPKQD